MTARVTTVVFITAVGTGLTSPRVVEDIFCRRLRPQNPDLDVLGREIDEYLCKGENNQRELITFKGVRSTLKSVPELFLAMPYIMLVDRYLTALPPQTKAVHTRVITTRRTGRRPIPVLSMVGAVLGMPWMMVAMHLGPRIPPWTMWLSPAWQVFGGGDSIMISMIYAMIADVQPPVGRANAFYLCIVGTIVAELIAVPASAKLMQISP